MRNGLIATISAVTFAAIAVATPTLSHAQLASSAWPMFHHDASHTGLSSVDTSANPGTQKWVFAHIGVDVTSPAVGADGTIYIGSHNRHLYALNPDGKEKWEFSTRGIVDTSPAIGANGTVYIGDEEGRIYAINPNGRKKWSAIADGSLIDSPAIGVDGTIYIGAISTLYALTDNGKSVTTKWIFDLDSFASVTSPAVSADGTIYFGSSDDNLYALNPDGTLKWKFATGGFVFSSPTIGADGTVYISSNDDNLYALNPDGTEKWVYATGFQVQSSPAIGADGTIYFGSGDFNLYALTDGGQGTVTEKWAFGTGGSIETSSPAISADGTIYIGSDPFLGGLLSAVNPDGTLKWVLPTNGKLDASSPTIGADGTIYVSDQSGKLYAVGAAGVLSVPVRLAFLIPRALNTSVVKMLTIKNVGFGVLHGNVGASTGPFVVTAGEGPFTLDHLKTWSVTIQFTPQMKGVATGVLSITSDDPKHMSVNVNLKGTGK
jgi:outer membrane protein assembly factor BamB